MGSGTGTSSITANPGGTLLLNGSSGVTDRIRNDAAMNLAGGKLELNGVSEGAAGTPGVGLLTLSFTSTIDFSGATGVIQFSGIAESGNATLSILNWGGNAGVGGGAERLLFSGTKSAFEGLFAQNDVSFNGIGGYSAIQFSESGNDYYEIVMIPEPATVAGSVALLGLIGFRERRRLASLLRRDVSLT